MTIHATYIHTDLIARDWQTLAASCSEGLGCTPVSLMLDLELQKKDSEQTV